MENLIEWLKTQTAGRQCRDCDAAIASLEDLRTNPEYVSVFKTFLLTVIISNDLPPQFHIGQTRKP